MWAKVYTSFHASGTAWLILLSECNSFVIHVLPLLPTCTVCILNMTHCLLYLVSLPHLVDFDWRLDVKTSSDSAVRMAQPTCLVQMKVRQ